MSNLNCYVEIMWVDHAGKESVIEKPKIKITFIDQHRARIWLEENGFHKKLDSKEFIKDDASIGLVINGCMMWRRNKDNPFIAIIHKEDVSVNPENIRFQYA